MAQTRCSWLWWDLPPELIGLVIGRLPSNADRVRFAAVCPQWRSAAREHRLPPPPLPWLALPDGTFFSFPHSDPLRFQDAAGFCGSCGDWLVFSGDDACSLVNPFSKATVQLPGLSCIRFREEPVETVNEREVPEWAMLDTWMAVMNDDDVYVRKLVTSSASAQLVAAIICIRDVGQIALCRPGASSWSVSRHDQCRRLEDIALYQGKLYAIDTEEALLAIDITDDDGEPRVSRIERLIEGPIGSRPRFSYTMFCLVESRGSLLMVRRRIFRRLTRIIRNCGRARSEDTKETRWSNFAVFEADLRSSRWAEVRSLGDDQVLFIGRGSSRAVCLSGLEMPGDRIFFLDDCPGGWNCKERPASVEAYDMTGWKVCLPLSTVSWNGGEMRAIWLFPRP